MASRRTSPSSRKKNNGKKLGTSAEKETGHVVYNITNYVYPPKECKAIQVGNENQMTLVDQAQELLHSSESGSNMSKNEAIIYMLFSILNPSCSLKPDAMPIHQLRNMFESTYRNLTPGKSLSFEEISGSKLLPFLQKNYTWFEITTGKKNEYMIKPIIRRSEKKKHRRTNSDVPSIVSEITEFDDADYQSALSCVSDIDDSFSTAQASCTITSRTSSCNTVVDYIEGENVNGDNTSSDSQQSWKEVKRKKRRPALQRSSEVMSEESDNDLKESETSADAHKQSRSQLSECKVNLFKKLIEMPENSSVMFHMSDYLYINEPNFFMLDVVSMWNTPNRTTSHIVIGVEPKISPPYSLIGLETGRSNSFYHDLFRSDFFSLKPQFEYFEVTFENKTFGIIEVPSSNGFGFPSITSVTQKNDIHVYFEPNQLWYRPEKQRKCCLMNDFATGLIFQWFSTKVMAVQKEIQSKKLEKTQKLVKLQKTSRKNAGTSTSFDSTVSEDEVSVISKSDEFYKVVDNFLKRNYVLVAGDLPNGMKNLEAFSLVPWIAVYDFDINSRDTGLLGSNEQFLRNRRSLKITNWSSKALGLTENGTVWTFLRGSRDTPESRLESEENENDARLWFKRVRHGLKSHIEQLQKFACDYTVLTILIIWPQTETLAPFIHKFLSRIDEDIEPTPKLVLVLPSSPKDEMSKSVYNFMCGEHGGNLTVIKMELPKVCAGIKYCLQSQTTEENIKYELPTADGAQNPNIEESEAAWLKEDMDVLYLSNTYSKKGASVPLKTLKEETEQFFKGGTLPWSAWYECGTGLDVDRDVKGMITTKIYGLLDENKSSLLTLFHEPGSGGTTLAQRILWDFHTQIPSAQIKLNTSSTVSDIAEKVELLYNKTHRQVLLLIDGEDEIKVKTLVRNIKSSSSVAIVIYVKRYTGRITDVQTRNEIWLKGNVSSREAKRLALKFGDRCDEDRKKVSLENLSKEVEKGSCHCLYEFGLTTYLHEFKGVTAYVRGYLGLNDNSAKVLLPWQKILGYLSLVYYYGQTSLPCQFFSQLLYLSPNYDVTVDDFTHPVERFIVPTVNEGKSKNVRICHYIIAKEILEQLLSRNCAKKEKRGAELSKSARQNLAEFCKDFIEYASRKKLKTSVPSSSIIHILTKTFIFRDNKDEGKYAEQTKKKSVVSRALTDIFSQPPLYTERLQVLEKLANSFPKDPNFHAHLGRFYAYCRPDDEDKAEKCFQKALELCDTQIHGKNICDIDERWRLSFMHIYHMYGTVLQKCISKVASDFQEKKDIKIDFLKRLEDVVELAKTACLYFQNCRDFAPPGQENTAGHVGEISVRLYVCDFVQKNFEKGDELHGIQKFMSTYTAEDSVAVNFVKQSVSLIDSLIMECYTEIEEDDSANYSLQKVVLWYNNLFQPKNVDLEKFATGDDIFSNRLKIAAKKLKYGQKSESITLLENITSEEVIKEIVHLYENIFKEVCSPEVKTNKKSLERDYIEWLLAIRHKSFREDYNLENVLLIVKQWNDYLSSPLSKFYLFILTSLLGFGTETEKGKTESLVEAQIHKEELHKLSKFVLRPRYPREWLGKTGCGIKCLLPGIRLLGIHPDEQEMKGVNQSELAICKGTICPPNKKKSAGLINLDLGNNTVPVKVFYIPNVAGLASSHYAGQRVEFILGFSLDHGYEAFTVKLLKKHGCTNCSNRIEITSMEDSAICSACSTYILKSELNLTE